MKLHYSISELAGEFKITTRTIRYYEDKGLIFPMRDGTARIYSNKDRVRLKLILRGKRVGFSLDEIKEILALYDLPEGERRQSELLLEKIDQRRQQLLHQKKDIDIILGELNSIESGVKGIDC